MSILSDILERLGLGQKKPVEPVAAGPQSRPKPGPTAPSQTYYRPPPNVNPLPKPKPIAVVDVYAQLEAMAAKRPDKLNWKTSIADLLFLLGMDHSYEARKELAIELHCPPNLMDDSAKMNTWLHKTVLTKIAENGGKIPKEMLD